MTGSYSLENGKTEVSQFWQFDVHASTTSILPLNPRTWALSASSLTQLYLLRNNTFYSSKVKHGDKPLGVISYLGVRFGDLEVYTPSIPKRSSAYNLCVQILAALS
jgi:hypothetical protein